MTKLKPADPSDLADTIAFALRFNRRKRYHEADKLMADLTADHIVRHLDNSECVVMKRPPALKQEKKPPAFWARGSTDKAGCGGRI